MVGMSAGFQWFIVWVVPLVGCLLSIPVAAGLLRSLRRDHPDIYRELGSPGWFKNNTPETANSISRYLFSRQYRHVPDRRFVLLCDLALGLQISATLWLIYALGSMLVTVLHY